MLQVSNLTKRYRGIPVVDGVSFSIAPGEILGYLGPNGAGKSTTIKMLIGLIEPSAGQILFHGNDVARDMKAFQSKLGYIPEETHLYPHLTGREYLQLAGRLRGINRRQLEPKMNELLRMLGLWEDRHSALASYSKGMRQKVVLAAALLHNPDLLVLDEPFSGLDTNTAMVLRSLLRELAASGKTILYSSHVLQAVEELATNVLILHNGRVLAHDSAARLRELTEMPSLEDVFARLTQAEDPDSIAREILGVVAS